MKTRIIIVTHNSAVYTNWQLKNLESSDSDLDIVIVDSGSKDTTYLNNLESKHHCQVIYRDNIGFVDANNIVMNLDWDGDFFLLLNPDAMIEGKELDLFLKEVSYIKSERSDIAVYSVPLIKYDIKRMSPMTIYDSMGIKCNLYGRWIDICQGKKIKKWNADIISTEAICGAFMLIDRRKLYSINKINEKFGFDPNLKMYKEDIELCMRLKKYGFKSVILPKFKAYHCRGWDRKKVADWARFYSAKNDLTIAIKYKYRALFFAILKYVVVSNKVKQRVIK